MKIDDINLAIIKMLRDGRVSYRDMAQALDLSETTVRTRATKLIEEGLLDVCGVVSAENIPGHTLAYIGVKLSTPDLVRKAQEASALKGVVAVAVVTGRFDLILTVLFKPDFGLLEFYTHEFTKCTEGVQFTETFIVYKGFNLKTPYVL